MGSEGTLYWQTRLSSFLMAPVWLDELSPWLPSIRDFPFLQMNRAIRMGGWGCGPQWKLKGIYSKKLSCVQIQAILTSRYMRQPALLGHGKWKQMWWQMKGILWPWSSQAWNPVGIQLLFTGNWHRVVTFPRQVGAIVFWHHEKH